MEISLEQAVEIHARALTHRLLGEAPSNARERATDFQKTGDSEGCVVWLRVAECAERLLREKAPAAPALDR
ncbi:hypothetical protein FM996_12645 [Methylosinus sporium]|uniref:Uncharacterized protein n=1 Tax=Methylosinus sporium TaxID=428 RepID=A0A549SRJ5_METSR|nr:MULTISPECIES: hypothetical protein [Methylosinus]MBU3886982.1 hypothetical protein [Methylosinus sp. KRF6]TRL32217.1 hypothetical protein FM996_12645 [Methylosinus sporium]